MTNWCQAVKKKILFLISNHSSQICKCLCISIGLINAMHCPPIIIPEFSSATFIYNI